MTERQFQDIGVLLAPILAQVPDPALPCFLAMLERGAAERYRLWAEQVPEHAAGLRACAAREEEIADGADRLVAVDSAVREKLEGLREGARSVYFGLFEGQPVLEQMRIQANAERQGAAAWRSMASGNPDARVGGELERFARLEETSADYLDSLLGR
jgi:hypothetical protein